MTNLHKAARPSHRPTGWVLGAVLLTVLAGGPAGAGLTTGVIDTVVGGSNGDGFNADLAKLNPAGLALDSAGNLFIADGTANRLRRIDAATDTISTIAGTGLAGYSGDGGAATAAQISDPAGVAVDSGGNIYFSDVLNSRVRRIDAHTGIITTATGGTYGPTGLAYPTGLAFAPDGTLLIADSANNRVQRVNLSTGVASTVAGVVGSFGYNGDNQLATSATLTNPSDVAADANGNVYIADTGNCRVRKVDVQTHVISTVAGTGSGTSSVKCAYTGDNGPATQATLNGPVSITLDASGHLFIAEIYQPRVRVVNLSNGIITTAVGTGLPGTSGDGGPATTAKLKQLSGLRVNARSTFLYIADSGAGTVRQVALQAQSPFTGVVDTVVGGANGDGFDADLAKIDPAGLAFDGGGNWFIADAMANRVRRIDGLSNVTSTIAGTGIGGYSGDGGPATAAQIADPAGVAVDSGGNIYVADVLNSRVRRIDAHTGIITTATGGTYGAAGLAYPAGLAFAPDGTLLIADSANNRVQRVNLSTSAVSTVAGVVGSFGYNGDNQLATSATLTNPSDVAADANGNVYIADIGNCRVRKVDVQTHVISTVAGTGSGTSAIKCAYTGDNGPATQATLNGPTNVALDTTGHLFIAETYQPRVRMVDFGTGLITTVVGTGLSGNSGDGGPATAARFKQPSGLRVDATGTFLYLADGGNENVRRVQLILSVPAQTGTPTKTPTPTRTSTPSATPTGLLSFRLSGQVLYYSNGLPVGTAMIQLDAGSTTVMQTQTDTNGQFAFSGVPSGNWRIQPGKIGEFGSAVGVLDAIYELQASVGLRTLNAAQQLACNVAGNGVPGVLDAILILQHSVGLITSFPVAQACGSDWAFIPQPASAPNQQIQQPHATSTSCQPGSITLQPLVGSATNQNFTAVLFGDCTGAWQPSHPSTAARRTGGSSEVRLGQLARHGHRVRVPLRVQANSSFDGLEATLTYDATQLTVRRVSLAGGARQALLEVNSGVPGTLKFALASSTPLRSGLLVRVDFAAANRNGPIPSVHLAGATVSGE